MSVRVEHGDCLDVMATLAAEGVTVDSIVTDPPYHLTNNTGSRSPFPGQYTPIGKPREPKGGFMGKKWDGGDVAFRPETWRLAFDLLKPGGYLIAFGGTRTYHRLACAIEDAGFEIRDQLQWLFGSGFPKSHDVSKAIDKAAPRVGMFDNFAQHYADRRRAACLSHNAICEVGKFYAEHNHGGASSNWEKGHNVPTLAQWRILKPLLGLSSKWLPLIERIEAEREIVGQNRNGDPVAWYAQSDRGDGFADITSPATAAAKQWDGWGTALKPASEPIVLARKPLSEKSVAANVLRHGTGAVNVDGCRVGTERGVPSSHSTASSTIGAIGISGQRIADELNPNLGRWPANVVHDGSDEVLEAFAAYGERLGAVSNGRKGVEGLYQDGIGAADQLPSFGDTGTAARFFYSAKADATDRLGSKHPTVKPVDLMRWLVRLVTPKNGTVLDPFAGTGTTGMACLAEGFDAILIEQEAEYVADIERRIAHVSGGDTPLFAPVAEGTA